MKKRNVVLKIFMMFFLVGCFSSQGGCEKTSEVRFFPNEKFTIDENFKFLFAELGDDKRVKKTNYSGTKLEFGSQTILGGDVARTRISTITPLKDGTARAQIYCKAKGEDMKSDLSPEFTVNSKIRNIEWTKNFKTKPRDICVGKNRVFFIGSRILENNEQDRSEFGITSFDETGKYLGFTYIDPNEYFGYFMDSIDNLYIRTGVNDIYSVTKYDKDLKKIVEKNLDYIYIGNDDNIIIFIDGKNNKLVQVNTADLSEIKKLDYIQGYDERMYLSNNKIIVSKDNYSSKTITLKVYDLDLNILFQKYYEEQNHNYEGYLFIENASKKYLIINHEKDAYPGALILSLDDNYRISKERYLAGYYIRKAYSGSSNKIYLKCKEIAPSRDVYSAWEAFMSINGDSEGINYIKSASKEIIDMTCINDQIYLWEYILDNTEFSMSKFTINSP